MVPSWSKFIGLISAGQWAPGSLMGCGDALNVCNVFYRIPQWSSYITMQLICIKNTHTLRKFIPIGIGIPS